MTVAVSQKAISFPNKYKNLHIGQMKQAGRKPKAKRGNSLKK